MKRFNPKTKVLSALIITVLVCGGVAAFFVHKHAESATGCGSAAVSAKIKATNDYDIPCELTITVNSPSGISQTDIERIAQPIKGTVESNDLSSSGIYFINVPPGTEDSAMRYLSSQSDIDSVARNHCCAVAN